jgi:hypothetical protein
MAYSQWGRRARVGRRLILFALILAPFVITAGGRLAYSSFSPIPSRRALPYHGATKPTPPRFLPASCAPQLAVTPVALDTPTPTAVTPTPTPSTAPVLDQAQLACTGGLSVRANPTQTFTVGIIGQLVRVDIPLCAPTKNVRIDLTVSTTDGSGQASTAALKLPHDYSDCAWYEFDYNKTLNVTLGDVLRLTVSSPNHKSALWGYDGQGDDPYRAGSGAWRGHTIDDFAFQTYVQ